MTVHKKTKKQREVNIWLDLHDSRNLIPNKPKQLWDFYVVNSTRLVAVTLYMSLVCTHLMTIFKYEAKCFSQLCYIPYI